MSLAPGYGRDGFGSAESEKATTRGYHWAALPGSGKHRCLLNPEDGTVVAPGGAHLSLHLWMTCMGTTLGGGLIVHRPLCYKDRGTSRDRPTSLA